MKLSIPDFVLHEANLAVTGADYAQVPNDKGQHYWIDGIEVSGCDAQCCDNTRSCQEGVKSAGISCVIGPCDRSRGTDKITYVSVNPVDITRRITPGIHTISASDIDNCQGRRKTVQLWRNKIVHLS